LPGGGVKAGEQPADAAMRELAEEVGLRVVSCHLIGQRYSEREYKRDTVYGFMCQVTDENFRLDNREIAQARWFDLNQLPDELSLMSRQIILSRSEERRVGKECRVRRSSKH